MTNSFVVYVCPMHGLGYTGVKILFVVYLKFDLTGHLDIIWNAQFCIAEAKTEGLLGTPRNWGFPAAAGAGAASGWQHREP